MFSYGEPKPQSLGEILEIFKKKKSEKDGFYGVLAVDKAADKATVQKSWRALSSRYSPDKSPFLLNDQNSPLNYEEREKANKNIKKFLTEIIQIVNEARDEAIKKIESQEKKEDSTQEMPANDFSQETSYKDPSYSMYLFMEALASEECTSEAQIAFLEKSMNDLDELLNSHYGANYLVDILGALLYEAQCHLIEKLGGIKGVTDKLGDQKYFYMRKLFEKVSNPKMQFTILQGLEAPFIRRMFSNGSGASPYKEDLKDLMDFNHIILFCNKHANPMFNSAYQSPKNWERRKQEEAKSDISPLQVVNHLLILFGEDYIIRQLKVCNLTHSVLAADRIPMIMETLPILLEQVSVDSVRKSIAKADDISIIINNKHPITAIKVLFEKLGPAHLSSIFNEKSKLDAFFAKHGKEVSQALTEVLESPVQAAAAKPFQRK